MDGLAFAYACVAAGSGMGDGRAERWWWCLAWDVERGHGHCTVCHFEAALQGCNIATSLSALWCCSDRQVLAGAAVRIRTSWGDIVITECSKKTGTRPVRLRWGIGCPQPHTRPARIHLPCYYCYAIVASIHIPRPVVFTTTKRTECSKEKDMEAKRAARMRSNISTYIVIE